MKKIISLFALLVATSSLGWSAPCGVGNLASYISLGATGCTIGDKLFSNFTFVSGSTGGAVVPTAAGIGVTPLDIAANPGLLVDIFMVAAANQAGDVTFGYTVTVLPGGNLIDDTSLSMIASVLGSGTVSIGQSECLGALLTSGCVGGTLASLETHLVPGFPDKIADANSFAPVSLVDIRKDIVVAGGSSGFATISGETQNYSETNIPEPATLSLLGTGLIGLAGLIRRKIRS